MTRNEVFTFNNVLLLCSLLVETSNLPINMGFLSSHLRRHNQTSKELRGVWIFQMNIYRINYKSIEHRIKRVYKDFLKFSKTHRDKRKKSWYDKAHCLKIWSRRDYMLKHMTLVKLERQNWNWIHLVSFSLKAKNYKQLFWHWILAKRTLLTKYFISWQLNSWTSKSKTENWNVLIIQIWWTL